VTTLEILVKARELIAEPERWTQGAFARDEHGFSRYVCPGEFDYTCYCASGALRAAGGYTTHPAYNAIHTGGPAVCVWNDAPGRTHAEVLAAFDAAIATERAKAQHV